MKRIIIYRFHKKPAICRNHLIFLKKLNPNTPIYGLYGGLKKDEQIFKKYLSPHLNGFYELGRKPKSWKWMHGDLAVSQWFRDVGKKIDFDVLHVIEWDLLLFESIEKLFKPIPKNAIGLTALQPLKKIEHRWYWTTREPYRTNWEEFLNYVKEKYNYEKEPFSSLGAAMTLPRSFLEKYSRMKIPAQVHDELRLPLFAQIMGYKLYNTGFYKHQKNERRYFNLLAQQIKIGTIKQELKKPRGRRVFHPYRTYLNLKPLQDLI